MKKLMIAVAAAAMVGGVFADTSTAYTLKASVKTTVGKAGKTTTYYYLGVNDEGNKFWCQDETMGGDGSTTGERNIKPDYFDEKVVNGRTIPCLSAEGKADIPWLKTHIIPLQATYGNKSAKKWCETGKFVEEGCYRVAGTQKFSAIVYGDVCCETLKDVEDDSEVLSISPSASAACRIRRPRRLRSTARRWTAPSPSPVRVPSARCSSTTMTTLPTRSSTPRISASRRFRATSSASSTLRTA